VDPSTLRVLVVDDQEHVRQFNASVLNALGIHDVSFADGGRAAIAAVTEPGAVFDLIICDLRMPDIDGIETFRSLATLGVDACVVITSVEHERVIESAGLLATEQGLTLLGEITKPLTIEKLRPALARLAELRAPHVAVGFTPTREEMERALDAAQLFLVYQPQIVMRTGRLAGVEALVRWKHPSAGVLDAGTFIPVAEQDDALIGRLTTSVLEEALGFIARWRSTGHDHTISVNLPARAFEVLDLPEQLEAMVAAHGVEPGVLTIEVSEARLSVDTVRTRDVVTRLRLKRFGLAIDNFGRGTSTLHRLRQTPFTELKIDRQYVNGCAKSAAARSIVETSLALAKTLGVVSVAEGVSGREDWDVLAEIGCDRAQGFFIARPMPEHGLEAWATQWALRP
jgi:EAL domain-containing protein (putative c-di-GMP-specific phosphodiesterase class I)/CheY-like chemotaxis protein